MKPLKLGDSPSRRDECRGGLIFLRQRRQLKWYSEVIYPFILFCLSAWGMPLAKSATATGGDSKYKPVYIDPSLPI